jgi:hypothetical protein
VLLREQRQLVVVRAVAGLQPQGAEQRLGLISGQLARGCVDGDG